MHICNLRRRVKYESTIPGWDDGFMSKTWGEHVLCSDNKKIRQNIYKSEKVCCAAMCV